MFRKETYFLLYWISFKGDFAHHLAVGMPDGDRNKFGVSFAFEYTKLLKQNLLYFIGLRSCSMSLPKSSVHGSSSILVGSVLI